MLRSSSAALGAGQLSSTDIPSLELDMMITAVVQTIRMKLTCNFGLDHIMYDNFTDSRGPFFFISLYISTQCTWKMRDSMCWMNKNKSPACFRSIWLCTSLTRWQPKSCEKQTSYSDTSDSFFNLHCKTCF